MLGADFPPFSARLSLVTNDPASGYHQCLYQRLRTGRSGQIGAAAGTSDSQLALPVNVTDLMILIRIRLPSAFGILHERERLWRAMDYWREERFPNFNEFAMESVFQLTRKLQVTRPSTNVTHQRIIRYNQMFNLSLSNQFGVECWNSYTNDLSPTQWPFT